MTKTHSMNLPKHKLPPLTALRSFEASARHLSFTLAAQELHVTQGAVSRQVKSLEDYFSVALFLRRPHGLELTEQGALLFPQLSRSFLQISQVSEKLLRRNKSEIRLQMPPTFAIRWMFPRLAEFKLLYPDINLRITTSWLAMDDDSDVDLHNFDLCIYCGLDTFSGVHVEKLRDEYMLPVCSPQLLNSDLPLKSPDDLINHTLLHPTTEMVDWKNWLSQTHVAGIDVQQGQVFSTLDMAITAAVRGYGITIADVSMIQDELEQQQLVMPFSLLSDSPYAYYLLCLPEKLDEQPIAQFADWLKSQIEEDLYAIRPHLDKLE